MLSAYEQARLARRLRNAGLGNWQARSCAAQQAALAVHDQGWTSWLPALRVDHESQLTLTALVRGRPQAQCLIRHAREYPPQRIHFFTTGWVVECQARRVAANGEAHWMCWSKQHFDALAAAAVYAVRHARNVHRRRPAHGGT